MEATATANQNQFADLYKCLRTTETEIKGKSQKAAICLKRKYAMYYMHYEMGLSHQEIADEIGRERSTVTITLGNVETMFKENRDKMMEYADLKDCMSSTSDDNICVKLSPLQRMHRESDFTLKIAAVQFEGFRRCTILQNKNRNQVLFKFSNGQQFRFSFQQLAKALFNHG